MKKFIILICLLIFLVPHSQANTCEIIETERQNCLNLNYQSDFTMAQCNYNAINKYDKEIKKLLKQFKKITDKTKYSFILNFHENRNKFIEQNDIMLEELFNNNSSGELQLVSSSIKYQNKKSQFEELLILYLYLSMK